MAKITAEMGHGVAEISRLRTHPIGFLWHYVCRHPWGHAIVFGSVLIAVVCAVSTQYGLKHLIDIVSLCIPVRARRRGQSAVARRRLGGRLHVCGGERRHSA